MFFGASRLPATVLFGEGQRAAAGALAAPLGRRVLVCTDARLAGAPPFAELLDNLKAAGLETLVYDRALPDLPIDCAEECAGLARGFGPDMVLGIGGGSCLDLAKAVALLLAHGGRLQDYYGEFRVPGPCLPVIALPTTAGTGSEVTPVAVLSDSERTLKVGVASPHLIPRIAICDPELTLTCPPGLTAIAGADALCHAVEAFTALRRPETPRLALDHVFVGKNAIGDVHALSAIRLLSEGLAAAVEDGGNRQARTAVMLGALQAGYAFGTAGTAAAHALQYPIGALTDTAHGLGVALLLPYVMEFNRPVATEELAAVALAMGAPPAAPEALARAAIDRVETLFRRIGIPGTLAGIGLDPTRMDWIAEQAATAARLVKNNPRPLAVADLKQIAQAAYDGRRDGLGVTPTGAEAAR